MLEGVVEAFGCFARCRTCVSSWGIVTLLERMKNVSYNAVVGDCNFLDGEGSLVCPLFMIARFWGLRAHRVRRYLMEVVGKNLRPVKQNWISGIGRSS